MGKCETATHEPLYHRIGCLLKQVHCSMKQEFCSLYLRGFRVVVISEYLHSLSQTVDNLHCLTLYPGEGEIFRNRPDWPWGPPSLLYNGYWVSSMGSIDHPPPPSAEVKERVELYLCSPSGPSWLVVG
jgi:hypothetical protein